MKGDLYLNDLFLFFGDMIPSDINNNLQNPQCFTEYHKYNLEKIH